MPPKAADSGSRAVGAIGLPDRRFGPVDAAVCSPLTRVLSVDVFDTLLWRRVPKPTDVFLLVARRLADRDGLAGHVDPRGFARLRLLAEAEARRRQRDLDGSVEVGLAEIYEVFDRDVTPGLSVADLVGAELGPLTAQLCAPDQPSDDSLMVTASGRPVSRERTCSSEK